MTHVHPTIDHINGFQAAGVHAGLKPDAELDFALFVSQADCATGGVFTTNTLKAACVLANMRRLTSHNHTIRAVAVNTKYANACTGEQGLTNAEQTAAWVAQRVGCSPDQVLVLSTGVIGTQLPMPHIENGVALSHNALGDNWPDAARAMMTTDTRPKMASATVTLDSGQSVQVAGVSKGSGMIAPNMATMLGLIFTDAVLPAADAQAMLATAAEKTFNRIVVDGDMSPNDMVFLLANGASQTPLVTSADHDRFQAALTAVARKLAQDIVRDGEGISKFITLHITGAASDADAHQIANTIATSPLVKTAFFGEDANWGRIVAAAGRAGVPFDPAAACLHIQPGEATERDPAAVKLFQGGVPTHYAEPDAAGVMAAASVTILLDCGIGRGAATVWTCDLSYDYVKINGDYRT